MRSRSAKQGFSLIELLVAVSITGVLFAGGLAAYKGIGARQLIKDAGASLQSSLRLYQQKALAGEKPQECAGDDKLLGYKVSYVNDEKKNSYLVEAVCELAKPAGLVISLPEGVEFKSAFVPEVIFFQVLSNHVEGAQTITLTTTDGSTSYQVRVDQSGLISGYLGPDRRSSPGKGSELISGLVYVLGTGAKVDLISGRCKLLSGESEAARPGKNSKVGVGGASFSVNTSGSFLINKLVADYPYSVGLTIGDEENYVCRCPSDCVYNGVYATASDLGFYVEEIGYKSVAGTVSIADNEAQVQMVEGKCQLASGSALMSKPGKGSKVSVGEESTNVSNQGAYAVDGLFKGIAYTVALTIGKPADYGCLCPPDCSYSGIKASAAGIDFYVKEIGNESVGGTVYIVDGEAQVQETEGKCQLTSGTPAAGKPGNGSKVAVGDQVTGVTSQGTYTIANLYKGVSYTAALTIGKPKLYECVCPGGCSYTGISASDSGVDFYVKAVE